MRLHSQMSYWLDLESPVLFLIYRCRWIGQMDGCAGGAGGVGHGKMTGGTVQEDGKPGEPASGRRAFCHCWETSELLWEPQSESWNK